ncbi:MAG: hydantoinase B/oxoprolinase family protein [Bacillota bacterium]
MKENEFLENPITTEIIRNALVSAANEMNESLFRSAYSPVIYEMKDCAVAIFNEKLQALGQSQGVPLFLGNLEESVKHSTEYYGGLDYYNEGDIFVLNDSYITGTHVNDITVFAPIFYRNELVGFSANRAHWLDVGSKDPGAPMNSTEIFQEGIRLGPLKLADRGVLRQDLIDTICLNSRFPRNARGDLHAQIAACKTGEKRFIEIIDRFGLNTVKRATLDIFKQSEILEREVIAKIPEGVYTAEGFCDNDGYNDKPVMVKVSITVKNGEIFIDLSGSGEMSEGNINCGFAQTVSACRLAYKMIIQPHGPVTGGSFKPLHVSAPRGTIFRAEEPAACAWYFSHLGLLIDLIMKAMQDAIPDMVAGAHYGDSMVIYLTGYNPKTGERYFSVEPTVGGWGALSTRDGQDCLINTVNGDFKNLPVEIFESETPAKIVRYEIRSDSAGPGKYRGGMGVIREYEMMTDDTELYLWFERSKDPAWGIRGGKTARPPKVLIKGEDGKVIDELLKTNGYPLKKGWRVELCTGGGGGYGDPLERDPEKVLEDYLQGYITREHAKSAYGVDIID